MKNYKLFQICYTLNFCFFLILVVIIGYRTFAQWETDSFNTYMFLGSVAVAAIFSIFNWLCFRLLIAVKNSRPLSKKWILTGTIFNIVCIGFTIFFISGLVTILNDVTTDRSLIVEQYLFIFCFTGLILTSIYLCIAYWLLFKKLKSNFSIAIDNLGNKD